MQTMYAAMTNSPITTLTNAITNIQTSFDVVNAAKLPAAPNLATIGNDEAAETILYTGKTGNTLTGITRAVDGTASAWAAGTTIARNFTAKDLNDIKANVEEVNASLADKLNKNGGTIEAYTEKKSTTVSATGTVTLDLSVQNVFEISPTGTVTIALSNVPASPKVCSFTIIINQPATAQSFVWPASFAWAGGNVPDISAVSKTHMIFCTTKDGGTRVYASASTGYTT